MKLIDIATNIDKSKHNESDVDTTDFNFEFNYAFDYVEQNRLKCYWIGNWYCTDSYVGWEMYFLDDIPVAVSSQMGRKSNKEFEWFSKDLALKVRDYLISIMPNEEEELNLTLCDINEDIGNSYKIEYNAQILSHYNKPTLNGEPVEIIQRIKDTLDYGIDKNLIIKLPNGDEKEINIRDLDFMFYVI